MDVWEVKNGEEFPIVRRLAPIRRRVALLACFQHLSRGGLAQRRNGLRRMTGAVMVARVTGVPPRRINEIVLGKRGITADTAVRLAAALGNRTLLAESAAKRGLVDIAAGRTVDSDAPGDHT
ncbi:helix-turn-helix domain-containing protein [Pantoea ananatis]|uniref:helix-turn-helix transcriptional regulator n=1 Tax=Pantoea ananas TaxID=553 RepID=UPI00221F5164|nr:helix-turn-helix domain-containing protein [Pantoea ananatis]